MKKLEEYTPDFNKCHRCGDPDKFMYDLCKSCYEIVFKNRCGKSKNNNKNERNKRDSGHLS